jgi:hypothetical protein
MNLLETVVVVLELEGIAMIKSRGKFGNPEKGIVRLWNPIPENW